MGTRWRLGGLSLLRSPGVITLGRVFIMRPAAPEDADWVRAVVLARSRWLEERGLATWRDSADDIASQTTAGNMWVLEASGWRVAGFTTVSDSAPPFGWTEEEFAQPADYLFTTCTDPAFRAHRPGTLIAHWAVDRAAARGRMAVRRGCYFTGLVELYRRQGFDLVHEVQHKTRRIYLMQRQAERLPLPGLATLEPQQ